MDQMYLDSEVLRSIADIIDKYCRLQNSTVNDYLTKIYALSNEWQDDQTFSQLVDEIKSLANQCNHYFYEINTTYPPHFRRLADTIDARPRYNGGNTPLSGFSGNSGISSHTSRSNTDVSGKVAVPINMAGLADFGNMDPRVSQVIVDTIAQTQQEFPKINLNFIGSTQSRNQYIQTALVEQYCDELRSYKPHLTEEQILSEAREMAKIATAKLNPEDGTLAVSMTGTGIYEAYSGISFNEKHAWNASQLNTVTVMASQSGHFADGCSNVKAVVDHELGHVLDDLVGASKDAQIMDAFGRFSSLSPVDKKDALSGYASSSIYEFIAEGWAEYRNNPQPRPYAQEIGSRITALYQNMAANEDSGPILKRIP